MEQYFEPDSNVLRLLTEDEWRGIGIVRTAPHVDHID